MRVKEFDDLGGGILVWAKCGCMRMAARMTFLDNSTNNEVRRELKRGCKVEVFKTDAGFRRHLQKGFTKCAKHIQKEQKKAVEQRLAVAI